MSVRIDQKGPVTVYLFRRTRDDRITQEMPAIIIPTESSGPPPLPSPPRDPSASGP